MPPYQNYADHTFGDAAFNWMPAMEPTYKRPNLQPNATFHVSALAPETKPTAVTRAMSKSAAGSTDTSAAPKAKSGSGSKKGAPTMLATFIATLATRPEQLMHGTGYGRHKVLDID